MMHTPIRRIIVPLGVVFLIAGIIAALMFFNKEKSGDVVPGVNTEEERSRYNVTEIDGVHTFEEGTHNVTGEVMMPTPCDVLASTVRVAESYPEQVTVSFDVRNKPEGMCVQVLTPQRFEVTFEASREARIRAEFMGESVPINLSQPTL